MEPRTLAGWTRRLAIAAVLALGFAVPVLAQSNLNPDLDPKWIGEDKNLVWPPNDGCAAPPVRITLAPGTELDRYGSEFGRFFANPGVSWDARALPYDRTKMPYAVYVVQKPLVVETCAIAPWFGAPGLGVQYKTADNVQILLGAGVLSGK
jgi:Tuberculosis necrotizing toxin